MESKELKSLRRIGKFFGWLTMLTILGIPTGLIVWLFLSFGWKITIASFIALPFLGIIVKACSATIDDQRRKDEGK